MACRGAPIKRFGFLQRRLVALEQLRQIVEAGRDSRIVRAEALLINGQGAPIKRFGVIQSVGVMRATLPDY